MGNTVSTHDQTATKVPVNAIAAAADISVKQAVGTAVHYSSEPYYLTKVNGAFVEDPACIVQWEIVRTLSHSTVEPDIDGTQISPRLIEGILLGIKIS